MLDKNEFEHRLSEVTQKNHKLHEDWTQRLTENTKLKTINQQLSEKYQDQKIVSEKNTGQLSTITQELTTTRQELLQNNERRLELESVLAQHKNHLAEQAKLMLDRERENATLTAELKATHQNLQESKSQVKALSHDKWILEQEKARLVADFDRLSENI